MKEDIADLRAPDPLGYEAPKISNLGQVAAGACTLNAPRLTYIAPVSLLWSGLVRVKSIHPDHKPRASAGLVRVVRVVRAKSHNIHMRACAYASLFFLRIVSFLKLKIDFVRNTPDHPDQTNASLHFRPDRPPGPTRTTRTTFSEGR